LYYESYDVVIKEEDDEPANLEELEKQMEKLQKQHTQLRDKVTHGHLRHTFVRDLLCKMRW